MTSEERHEARYQRRVKKRQERRLALSKSCGDFEDVFSYENLYQAGHICCRGVSWKSSTQMYRFNLVTNTATTRRALLDGSYKGRGFIEFDLYDRGKMRHIRSIHISERVVQRTLCDKVINPTLKPSFIYDNGASTENKGIDFALNRLSCHLQRHYRKYGQEGYVLLFDFSNYFANAQHWPVSRELAKRVHDVRIRSLANECLDNFGPIGYGLGSQISQTAALMLPNKLDHFIKEKLGIKGYARYMDDGYLIHPSKEYLKECLTRMKEVCDSLGIVLNTKKTKIKKLSEGFKFLQIRFKLTETGKVLRKMSFESIKKIRRKLKKFKCAQIGRCAEQLKVLLHTGSVRNILLYRIRRNPLREHRMAEKGIVTEGHRCDCFLILRRYEDKIGFIECKVPVPVFCRYGKGLETHVITLSRYL